MRRQLYAIGLVLLFFRVDAVAQSSLTLNDANIISTYVDLSIREFDDGSPAIGVPVGWVTGVAAARDSAGGAYFVSPEHNKVLRVLADGRLFLVAGSPQGERGFSGDGGPATEALLSNPEDIAVDIDGTVFVTTNGRIRKIDTNGVIQSVPIPRNSYPTALATDVRHNLYFFNEARYRVYKWTRAGELTVVAGTGRRGFSGDGGPATLADLGAAGGIAVDDKGNLYISDFTHHRIRKITADGIIRTVAGNGLTGFSGDGRATSVSLDSPRGLAVDAAGNLYIADYFNGAVRRLTTGGSLRTIAGTPYIGPTAEGLSRMGGGFSGDGGPARMAALAHPISVAVDSAGRVYIADSNNRRIRQIQNDTIQTVAGDGDLGVRDFRPTDLVVDDQGNLYFADDGSNRVYKRTRSGKLSVVAGGGPSLGDGVPATQAGLLGLSGIAIDTHGNLYIATGYKNRVRKVSTDGTITTVAGNGVQGFSGDRRAATEARLNLPTDVAADDQGNLYIADSANHRIRKVTSGGIITTIHHDDEERRRPRHLAVDKNGNVFFTTLLDPDFYGTDWRNDPSDNLLRKLTPDGSVSTLAEFSKVPVDTLFGLALDTDGNAYVSQGNKQRVFKISPDGSVTRAAGSGRAGYRGDGGPAYLARLYIPSGVAVDPLGILYIADSYNGVIRRVPLGNSATFSIRDHRAVSFETGATSATVSVGLGAILPDGQNTTPSGLAVLGSFHEGLLVSEAIVEATPAIRSGRVLAEVAGSVNIKLAMANPTAEPVAITFFFSNGTGDFGNGRFVLPSKGHVVAFLTEPPFNSPAHLAGTLTFEASAPIAVAALRELTNERSESLITTVAVVDLGSPPATGTSWLPHFVDGAGWSTGIALVNPTGNSIAGQIRFRDSSGSPLTLNVNGVWGEEFAYSIPARASQTFGTSGTGSSTLTGSVVIDPDQSWAVAPEAVAVFTNRPDEVTVTAAAVESVPAASHFRLYVESEGAFDLQEPWSIQTGIAIANTTGSPVSVWLSLPSRFPLPPPRGSITVPADGHVAFFLNEFPEFPSEFRGVLRVSSQVPISVLALRARYNQRGDFLITSIPPVDVRGAPVREALYFPYFAASEGNTAQFVLYMGRGGPSSSGAVKFFSESEEPLNLRPR